MVQIHLDMRGEHERRADVIPGANQLLEAPAKDRFPDSSISSNWAAVGLRHSLFCRLSSSQLTVIGVMPRPLEVLK